MSVRSMEGNPSWVDCLPFSAVAVLFVVFIVAPISAWVTHIIISIKTASWVLLVVGSVVFPVGIVHGAAVWFGIL